MNSAENREINIKDSTILIVDDNPANLGLLFNYLTKQGFKVLVADGGKTAINLVREIKPDLVLLDIVMPEIDGFEVCREIKKDEETKDIPVIFLSALTATAEKIKGFATGGVDYITKPFQYAELVARVNAHLLIQHQQKKLLEYNDNLENTNARKDMLFSIISHDIKTPLSTILGYSDIIMEDFDNLSSDEIKQYNFYINNVAKEINGLIDNLLEWSRFQRGRLDFTQEEFNLYNVVTKVLRLFHEAADLKHIKIVNECPGESIVFADENMVYTILRNLISNAIKFTGDEGVVKISAEKGEGELLVTISDSGIGIAREDIGKLFKMDTKHSTLGTAKEKGTGLGLILCREFVEKNGGAIWVDSMPGEGSSFYFTLKTMATKDENK